MHAPSLSIRLVWPFARLMSDYGAELRLMDSQPGLLGGGVGDPDARISESLAMRLLEVSLRKTGQPALGLQAGARVESGDFGVVDAAARCADDFGQALRMCSRYLGLLDESILPQVAEEGSHVIWRLWSTGGERPCASNDFAVRSAVQLGHLWLGMREAPIEVHLAHARPDYASEYRAAFGCPVRWGQPSNAVVMPRLALALPMVARNPDLFAAFEAQAARLLAERTVRNGTTMRAERTIAELLQAGPAPMVVVAKRLKMSVATLRRRLAEEGTTHRQILERVRCRTAVRRLQQEDLSVSQIAFSLSFASPQVFCRAFRRWTGKSPAEYRESVLLRQGGPRGSVE